MFLRTVKAAGGGGVQHEYVRLVEAYREDGKNKQRVVCNLGRKDLLAEHLDALIRLLRGEPRAAGRGPCTRSAPGTGADARGAHALGRGSGSIACLTRRAGAGRRTA
jgi:hypothetical protein